MCFVVFEELSQMAKSKPVLRCRRPDLGAHRLCLHASRAKSPAAEAAAQHTIFEYGELFLFLLVAITYVNTLEERRVFDVLRAKPRQSRTLSYRSLFWLTGILAFFLSSVLDNLTTALIMGAVVHGGRPRLATLRCARLHQHRRGGQCRRRLLALRRHHHLDGLAEGQGRSSVEFFALFIPSAIVNWLVPAAIMHFAVPRTQPARAG